LNQFNKQNLEYREKEQNLLSFYKNIVIKMFKKRTRPYKLTVNQIRKVNYYNKDIANKNWIIIKKEEVRKQDKKYRRKIPDYL